MTTYLLCHGAWSGGWMWRRVAKILRDEGHDVYTPTYTGLGERVHLLTPEVGVHTHIQDIRNVIHYERLDNFVLVGHSYGGMVVTGVADKEWKKISRLVYLDAFLPEDGQSTHSMAGPERSLGDQTARSPRREAVPGARDWAGRCASRETRYCRCTPRSGPGPGRSPARR